MKLSVELHPIRKVYGEYDALDVIKKAGFDAVDYSCYFLNETNDVINWPNRAEYAKRLRDHAEELGLVFNQAHAAFKYGYGKGHDTKEYQDIIRSMEFAAMLGAPHIIVHSVKPPREDRSLDPYEINREFFLGLEPYCEEFGIKIAVENLFYKDKLRDTYYGLFGLPEEMNAFVDSLNSDNFITCCDVGHASLIGIEPQDFILGMKNDRLLSLHIHDNDYRADRHWLPYLGNMNWDAIADALGKIDYRGDFTLETLHFADNFPKEILPESLKFTATVARHLMEKVEAARAEILR